MVKMRVRFEPIDIPVENLVAYELLYNSILKSINGMHKKEYDEFMPSIRNTYRVDDYGLPVRD